MLRDCIDDKPVTFDSFKQILDREFPLIRHLWKGDFKTFLEEGLCFSFESSHTTSTEEEFKDRYKILKKLKYRLILVRSKGLGDKDVWYITPIGQLEILSKLLSVSLFEQEKRLVILREIDTTTDPFHIINGKTYVQVNKLTDNYTLTLKD